MRRLPDELMWLLAVISLALPLAGALLIIGGIIVHAQAGENVRWWFGTGALCFALDYVLDVWLARFVNVGSEVPDLNARGARHIGRIVVLEQGIDAGRGRVRIGDSWWSVEGPEMPAGAKVRIIAVRGAVLVVEPL